MHKINSLVLLILTLIGATHAQAEWKVLPESRHQQYMTYALFTEEHTSLLALNGARAWGALAGAISLLEADHYGWKPQFLLHGSATSSFRFKPGATGELLTDTTDARVGFLIDMELDAHNRLNFGWTHWSGHISDNIPDTALIGPNVGNEFIRLRYLHDTEQFRLGGTLKPFYSSEPGIRAFAADQFAEFWPLGMTPDQKTWRPYVALSFEEYGSNRIQLTTHAQAGMALGNHSRPEHHQSMRAVMGYYNGVDPRLKYAEYRYMRRVFGYLGLQFDL